MKAAGILIRGNQGQLYAWGEAKDTVAGDFEDSVILAEPVVLLPTTFQFWNDHCRI